MKRHSIARLVWEFPKNVMRRGWGYRHDEVWFEVPKIKYPDVSHYRLFADGIWRRLYLRRRVLYLWKFTLRLHTFYSGDEGTPHDHPWWFVTFPLRGYVEEVYGTYYMGENCVRPFRFHFRPATYRHVVQESDRPFHTIVISGARSRKWGFWPSKWFGPYVYEEGDFVPYDEWTRYE